MNAEKENKESKPNNLTGGIASYFPPQYPAAKFPAKLVKNQHPIVRERKRFGASFETKDNPIGDKQSSAKVIIKYDNISHSGETADICDK